MIHLTLEDLLQWAGTACLMTMYIVMSFFPTLHPWNLVAGCLGGSCYLAWTILVANKPQMIVNGMGVTITVLGLFKAWG
jgi:hypothetical protein